MLEMKFPPFFTLNTLNLNPFLIYKYLEKTLDLFIFLFPLSGVSFQIS